MDGILIKKIPETPKTIKELGEEVVILLDLIKKEDSKQKPSPKILKQLHEKLEEIRSEIRRMNGEDVVPIHVVRNETNDTQTEESLNPEWTSEKEDKLNALKRRLQELQNPPKEEQKFKKKTGKLGRLLKRGILASSLVAGGAGVGVVATANELGVPPSQLGAMALNWKERHIDRKDEDDPSIEGIGVNYDRKRVNYDFIGEQKIDYKSGYYVTSVFDLVKKSNPPQFKIIERPRGGGSINPINSAAGIVTNLLRPFETIERIMEQNKGKENLRDLSVIAYNTKTQTIKVGHLAEFNEDWLVSEIREVSLDFDTNPDGSLKLKYGEGIMRMAPLLKPKNGIQDILPIGITNDRTITSINPHEANRFGTLEGGKIILVSGDIQLQVNGSFADIYRVYEKLKKDYPGNEVQAFILDNGAYNLPIWNKREDRVLTEAQIREHLARHKEGGTALVLIES